MAKGNSAKAMGMPDGWQAEQDLRTLMECEAIEKDPKRLKAAQKLAKEKLAELNNVIGDKD